MAGKSCGCWGGGASFTCSQLNGCSVGDLGDVDTTTTPPAAGDTLVFQGGQWVPGSVGGGDTYLPGDGIAFTSTTPGVVNINADLSEQAGNQLVFAPDGGLYVPAPTDQTVVVGQDTATVDMTVDEAPDNTFTVSALAKVSAAAGNTLTANGDGLFVPSGVTAVTTTDTTTLDLTTTPNPDGSVTISGAPIISPDAGNGLTARGNGLYQAERFYQTSDLVVASVPGSLGEQDVAGLVPADNADHVLVTSAPVTFANPSPVLPMQCIAMVQIQHCQFRYYDGYLWVIVFTRLNMTGSITMSSRMHELYHANFNSDPDTTAALATVGTQLPVRFTLPPNGSVNLTVEGGMQLAPENIGRSTVYAVEHKVTVWGGN